MSRGWTRGYSKNEKKKKEGPATVHWAMSLVSSFLDCIFFFTYLPCKGSRPRSTTLDFLPCGSDLCSFQAAKPFPSGGFYASWSGCVLEPKRPHCSLPACFTPQQDMDDRPPKIRQSDPSSASRMTPGPGPFHPARPRSISPFPFGGRGPSARWPAKAGRSEWPDRHGSMPHPTRARHGRVSSFC